MDIKVVLILPIKYKIDVIAALKKAGFSTYKIRKEKIMSESTLQKFRNGEIVTADNLALICKLLGCQPGDILEYVEKPE
ncbi:MAG: helix-turn-helix domain-containing protein [Prevotella sp.]|nr:helix-turn-helix domain-containing protein [Prevotella sp.]